jgi:2-aminoethylphosphonate-pyruvate transaminase
MTETLQKDKLLFTPGPLTTSATVKAAMRRDLGSRDAEFISVIKTIRAKLLVLAGQADDSIYTAIPLQGSGTYAVESVLSTTVAPDARILVVINGAYGKRIAHIASVLKLETKLITYPENQKPNPADVDAALKADPQIGMVCVIHCETTTGMLNPIAEIGEVVAAHNRCYFVDAMSSFGAIPIDIAAEHIDYLVSSSNKCIEGVPGFSFVIARKTSLNASEGYARSVSLDILAQGRELDRGGQFRFTPPTHVMLAFHQALLELEQEGGIPARAARYHANHDAVLAGMRALGFREYLAEADQSYIITTFYYPEHPNFNFETFYRTLSTKGCVIYPGKLGEVDCFRIGNIGRLYPADMQTLLDAIRETLIEMDIAPERH